ncbi:MAG: hypothetical protein IT196_11425 [Acidimicrobiales bacterium]|nr:hypothetical protein [Acidimicrobiales bacterium]
MNQIDHIEAAWHIDPVTVQRLWPVIDVYGRIARALLADAAPVDTGVARLTSRDSAA